MDAVLTLFPLQKHDALVGITIDTWTSPNKIAILAITCSWIDTSWVYCTACIAFEVIRGPHDHVNLAEIVLRILRKYKLGAKVRSIYVFLLV